MSYDDFKLSTPPDSEQEIEVLKCEACNDEVEWLTPLGIEAYGLNKHSLVCLGCLNNLHDEYTLITND